MFRTVPLSIIRSFFLLYTQQWYMSCRFADSLRAISHIYFWNKILHVSDSSSVHHQEFFYCTHSNGICHTGLLTACELFLIFIFGIKLYLFRKVTLSIIRSFSLHTQRWYMSYRFDGSLRAISHI